MVARMAKRTTRIPSSNQLLWIQSLYCVMASPGTESRKSYDLEHR
jgi:hypothetical protein